MSIECTDGAWSASTNLACRRGEPRPRSATLCARVRRGCRRISSRRAADEAERLFGVRPANPRPALTPRFELGDLAFSFAVRGGQAKGDGLKPREVADRPGAGAGGGRRACAGSRSPAPATSTSTSTAAASPASSSPRSRAGAPLGRPLVPGQGGHRAHQHQPQQGGAHRPRAQRRARRHAGARCCARSATRSRSQNYIDDTGVQVADVVVGFLDIEGKDLAEVRGDAGAVRSLLLGPLRQGRQVVRRGSGRARVAPRTRS